MYKTKKVHKINQTKYDKNHTAFIHDFKLEISKILFNIYSLHIFTYTLLLHRK